MTELAELKPLGPDERVRALAAIRQARKQYPGLVGEILADAIDDWRELGYWANLDGPVPRLIRELVP